MLCYVAGDIPPSTVGRYAILFLMLVIPLLGCGRRAPATKRSSENKRRLRPGKCVQNAFAATHRLDDADTIASSFAARDFLSNSWWDEFLARGSERNGSGGSASRLEVSKMSWSVFEILLVS